MDDMREVVTLVSVKVFCGWARAVISGAPQGIPPVWSFGATPAEADDLLGLVRAGVKTATSSLYCDYELSGSELPAVGQLNIVCDRAGAPVVVLRTVGVEVCRFDEVSADFAAAEGEGDRTLAFWGRSIVGFGWSMPCVILGRMLWWCASALRWCMTFLGEVVALGRFAEHTENITNCFLKKVFLCLLAQ